MDYVKEVVAQVVGDATPADWSSACLATTNPVYLLFSPTQSIPVYVVRVTSSAQACTHDLSVLIHQAAGDLVPTPIAMVQQDGKRFSIQRGVPGAPWFQIAQHYATPAQWNHLKTLANDTLQEFHRRISCALPQERQLIRPDEELQKAYQTFHQINGTAPSGLEALVNDYKAVLESLGEIRGTPQHGDFSLNNLIVQEDSLQVTIIDFEDFGITQMPLYDEFTLALSFTSTAPDNLKAELHDELSQGVKASSASTGYDRQVIKGLFLFHLLTRLGHWSLGTKRQPYRLWLLLLLDMFIENPETLFPE